MLYIILSTLGAAVLTRSGTSANTKIWSIIFCEWPYFTHQVTPNFETNQADRWYVCAVACKYAVSTVPWNYLQFWFGRFARVYCYLFQMIPSIQSGCVVQSHSQHSGVAIHDSICARYSSSVPFRIHWLKFDPLKFQRAGRSYPTWSHWPVSGI